MKRILGLGRVIGCCALALGIAGSAAAQDVPRAELSAGYQFLSLKSAGDTGDGFDESLGKGWYADVAGNLGRSFAVLFQVSGNYKTFEETETFQGVTSTVTVDFKVHTFMGGVRVSARPNRTVAPFAQFLVGGVNGSADVSGSVTGGGQTFFSSSSSDSSTDLGIQAGGGVNIWLSEKFGVRVGADYLRVFGDEDVDLNAFRFVGGAVFGF